MKRLIAVSDLHCGHITGMTPPQYRMKQGQSKHIHDHQKETWDRLKRLAKEATNTKLKTVLICNGDAVQGKQHEAWISDLETQQEMATETLRLFNVDKIFMARGTPVHTQVEINLENRIAEKVDAVIENEVYVSIEKMIVYARHKIGRSVLPHGKFTAVARKAVEQLNKSQQGFVPQPSLCLFGHVHYFAGVEDSEWSAYALPALQTYSEFGEKICDGIVHWGILWWDIEDGKIKNFEKRIERVETAYPKVHQV